jgi:hypothetical protein
MAEKQLNVKHPLAEVFGFKFDKHSNDAASARAKKLCPFNNVSPNCTKDKVDTPLAVCSIFHKDTPTIICPVRFREDWIVCEDAAEFFFKSNVKWTPVKEIRLKDRSGRPAGNIDLVVIHHDDAGRVIDFGAVEVQAVYISGNVRKPFEHYMKDPASRWNMDWTTEKHYPGPDFLSSSRKRLVPQLSYKGQILNAWGKKQVVVVDRPFFDSLPPLEACNRKESDLCWLVYKMNDSPKGRGYKLGLDKLVYTGFEDTMKKLGNPEVGELSDFIGDLEDKLAIALRELKELHGVGSLSELLKKNREKSQNSRLTPSDSDLSL